MDMFKIHEDTPYVLHCFTDHKEYDRNIIHIAAPSAMYRQNSAPRTGSKIKMGVSSDT